jgi:hypothetical protein
MKTLITALAVTAMLAIPAAAKTQRTRAAHIEPNRVVSHNSVSRNPVAQLKASYCRFHDGEADPDAQVRLCLYFNPADRAKLEEIVANRDSPRKWVWRADIALATADGLGTNAVMRRTGKSKPCLWRWPGALYG